MKIQFSTGDSRLAAFIQARGIPLTGTETKYLGDDDRVHLLFEVEQDEITGIKRDFFEGGSCPALELLNCHKAVMHTIREARELAREAR